MRRHFEEAEEYLKNRLLSMGERAQRMIAAAVQSLLERNMELLKDIFADEKEVNNLHIEVDDRCLKLIALHQPTATDLRFIMAAVKINSNVERIADQAVNIAQNTKVLLSFPELKKNIFNIPLMANLARNMVKDSLDAFLDRNVDLARSVLARDHEEDQMKSEAFRVLMRLMQSDSSTIQGALGLILISRNLEKVADHATNIAEDVIFMVLGKDIRHGAQSPASP